eukprot:TRINITY_DN27604_c0_g1_i1.p1 TRINITY_DN27604_c0_g1~~TRINITY_DN27604_c0_g1_i1.p1  ORF type:complete len:743 (+),score=127.60 TRINITY_DN27604_c0_g1_i1:162-2231(+)
MHGYAPIPQDDQIHQPELPLLSIQPTRGASKPMRTSQMQGMQATRSCREKWESGYFTVNPEDNLVLEAWDVVVITALLFTAIILPFEVALIDKPPFKLYVTDKVIDCIFGIDIIVTFNVAFPSGNSVNYEAYERRPLEIAKQYMAFPFSENMTAGWFWPDVLTVMPWDLLIHGQSEEMQSVRVVRVLRLVRMLRLVRVVKLFKRWHTHFGFSFAMVKIVRCMGLTLVSLHWLACWWAHIGMNAEDYWDNDRGSWLSSAKLAANRQVSEISPFEAYSLALYFCTVVLVTVGFGDLTPVTHIEFVIMTITIFATGLTWAWVVANVVDVIANLDVFGNNFNQAMDDLNQLMASTGVTQDLKLRVRKYLHEAYFVQRQRHHRQTISWLSEGLQGEFAVESGVGAICRNITYLRELMDKAGDDQGMELQWITDIAQYFNAQMFGPKEFIWHKDSLAVLRKGSAARRGKILLRDSVIGEDMILTTERLKDSVCPGTLTSCEVMTLSRDALRKVCEKHEDLNIFIRKAQIRLAVRRGFIYVAQKMKQMKQDAKAKGVDVQPDLERFDTRIITGKVMGFVEHLQSMEYEKAQGGPLAVNARESMGVLRRAQSLLPANGVHAEGMDSKLQALESRLDQIEASRQQSQTHMEGMMQKLLDKVMEVSDRQKSIERQLEKAAASSPNGANPGSPSMKMPWR